MPALWAPSILRNNTIKELKFIVLQMILARNWMARGIPAVPQKDFFQNQCDVRMGLGFFRHTFS